MWELNEHESFVPPTVTFDGLDHLHRFHDH